MFIMHNSRTFRMSTDPKCPNCGARVLYYAHDTESVDGGVPTTEYCADHNSWSWVYLESAPKPVPFGKPIDHRYVHYCPGESTPRYYSGDPKAAVRGGSQDDGDDEPEAIPAPRIPEPKPVPAPDPNDPLAGLKAYILTVMSEHATTAEIEHMVSTKIAEAKADMVASTAETIKAVLKDMGALPTRVEVKYPNGEVRKVEGLAHNKVPTIIRSLSVPNRSVFLAGPAGTGKTHICKQVAEALQLEFYPMSVGPTMTETRIQGYMDANGKFVETPFYLWCKFGGLFLLDEADSGNPAVLTVLNAALSNRFYTFPNGEKVFLHETCKCAVGANTIGRGADRIYVGRNKLDGAFLDRFAFIPVDVDEALEMALCKATGLAEIKVVKVLTYVRKVRANVAAAKLDVIVGPRGAIRVCEDLMVGFTMAEAIEMHIRKGASDADWSKMSMDAPSIYGI